MAPGTGRAADANGGARLLGFHTSWLDYVVDSLVVCALLGFDILLLLWQVVIVDFQLSTSEFWFVEVIGFSFYFKSNPE